MQTEKTIRTDTQWLKITRDRRTCKYVFARGYAGSVSAHDVKSYSFAYIGTWKDAEDFAKRSLKDYE